jgi:AcrR family transcriptional regulator
MPVKKAKERRPYKSNARAAAAEDTRARIVAAARDVLAGGKDSPGFSLDAVARAADVTRLTVYNQFESRRGLLEAVFDDTARRGGLHDLRSVLADADVDRAMQRFVNVFCRFWSAHGSVFPKFSAVARLDDEISASLKQRTERRRQALKVLIGRMSPAPKKPEDLIDLLYSLTSFELFDSLSVRNRSAAAIEAMIQQLVADAIRRSMR